MILPKNVLVLVAFSVFVLCGLVAVAPPAWSQTEEPDLLGDFVDNPWNLDSLDPSFGFHMAALGDDRVVFVAHDLQQGTELWATDGTAAGTRLLRDIDAGPNSSLPQQLTALGDRVYFAADDGILGRELWVTDGTPQGTRRVRDGRPGPASLIPFRPEIEAGADRVVFSALGEAGAPELWESDGTRGGTGRLSLGPLPAGRRIVDLKVGANLVYFRLAEDGSSDGDLWVTDGTEGGTRRLVTACKSCRLELVDDDRLFFVRRTGQGSEAWTSDGTVPGTASLGDLCAGSCSGHPRNFFAWQGDVFFVAEASDVSYEAQHLYRTDGTAAGTSVVIAGGEGGRGAVAHPVRLGDRLYFTSHTFQSEFSLWTTDADFDDVSRVVQLQRNLAFSLAASDGLLFFSFRSATTQKAEFWRSDGTAEGTFRLRRFDPAPGSTLLDLGATHLTPLGERVVFRAHTSGSGWEPWVSGGETGDTAPLGTVPLGDLDVDPNGTGEALPPAVYGERAAFWVSDMGDWSLVTTDGTPMGTEVVETPVLQGGETVEFDGDLLFSASFGGLWRTTGTVSEFVQLSDELMGAGGFVRSGDQVLFQGVGVYYNVELWRSDGTPGGTEMVADLVPGVTGVITGCCANSSSPRQFKAAGGEVFFVADSAEGSDDAELWRSDGTTAGTVRVGDLCPGLCSSDPDLLTPVGEALYFSAFDGSHRTLWRLPLGDGASATPQSLGAQNGRHVGAAAALGGGVAYFASVEGSPGHHLFLADATGELTRVRDLATQGLPTYAHDAVSYGDRVVFRAANEVYGDELWVTDGTPAGTRLIDDLWPGPAGSDPGVLHRVGDVLVFSANGGAGHEPWAYDGYGLRPLADVNPGVDASLPTDFTLVGDRMIFEAWTPETGREMWTLPAPQVEPRDDRVLELLDGRFEVSVDWRNQHDGGSTGVGTARSYSENTGFFWFFGPENVELALKILDGRPLNDHFWLLYGGLSDVEYAIRIEDRETGVVKTYVNEPGDICGQADVGAFPDPVASWGSASQGSVKSVGLADPKTGGDLLLQEGRFRVSVDWRNQHDGGSRGVGDPIPATNESGYFSFFDPGNVELIVKILDARTFNGKFWVFYGALTDLEYTLRVEDTVTGDVKIYQNPPGSICGGADTSAF